MTRLRSQPSVLGNATYQEDSVSGAAVAQKSTDRAGHINVQSDYRGVYPASYHLQVTGAAGTNDNDVVYTSGDITTYNVHYVEATAGTVDVDVSIDGTNWIAAVAGVSLVTTTPATRAIDAASGVCLRIEGKFKKLRVNQKGAVASNARIAHAWE